jgi:hypothetical protein
MDGGGRAVSGTKAENNAGSSYRTSAAQEMQSEQYLAQSHRA